MAFTTERPLPRNSNVCLVTTEIKLYGSIDVCLSFPTFTFLAGAVGVSRQNRNASEHGLLSYLEY